MITGLAVSVLLLHPHRRVAGRRAVNYDYAGALTGQWPKKGECLPDKEGHYVEVPQVHPGAMLLS